MTKGERPASAPQTKSTRPHSSSRGRSRSRADTVQRVRFAATPSRSPTPPPPAGDKSSNSKRKYSEAEDVYFFKCVKWQLKRDPYTSGKQMARVLVEKVRL